MKLKRIYIKKYKNIHEQELTFCNEAGYLALIGENGSGKTNWLEAVSMIFRSIYAKDVPFTYELDYEIGDHLYNLIHKKRGEGYSLSIRLDGKVVKRDAVIIPRIIACYSGESNRLWGLAYRDYFNQFFKRAIRNKIDIPEMLYVNKYYWNIALITLMCSDDPAIKEFLKEHFGFDNLDNVSVTFDLIPENIEKFSDNKVTQLLTRLDRGEKSTTLPMSELASIDIDHRNNLDFCCRIFYYLFIASLPEVNDDNPVSKAISRITVKVNDINAYSFSEGEQKMILVKCLTQLLADENTLLVFDEPDAHVHIANKIEIVTAISSYRGQAILTTHSPIVINELKPECIRYVEKGTVNLSDKIETIRRVSGNNISLIDGAFILSARKLVVTEGPYDISYIKTAINKLGETESKYLKLNSVAFIYQGSAGNTKSYIDNVIKPIINDMDKILFVFDYDAGQGGDQSGQQGYHEVENVKDQYDGHLECIYYSNDYSVEPSVFYVEDFFTPDFYPDAQTKVDGVPIPLTYRILKEIKGISGSIKKEIEKNYSNKSSEKYEAFRPLLDKLLDVFSLAV